MLSARTPGWIAVGFNTDSDLAGTRFLMGCASRQPHAPASERWQEHIARPPEHIQIDPAYTSPLFDKVSVNFTDDRHQMHFTAHRLAADGSAPALTSGGRIGLMLAYSSSPEFAQHSAWRRHYTIRI